MASAVAEHVKDVAQEAVDPAPESPAPEDVVGPAPVRRRASEIEIGGKDASISVLIAFLQEELKALCRLHGQGVSGNKSDLVQRLLEVDELFTEAQAKYMLVLRRKAFSRKVRAEITKEDVITKRAASKWIEMVSKEMGIGATKRKGT